LLARPAPHLRLLARAWLAARDGAGRLATPRPSRGDDRAGLRGGGRPSRTLELSRGPRERLHRHRARQGTRGVGGCSQARPRLRARQPARGRLLLPDRSPHPPWGRHGVTIRLLSRRKAAVLGTAILGLIIALAVAGSAVTRTDPLKMNLVKALSPPSAAHPFG